MNYNYNYIFCSAPEDRYNFLKVKKSLKSFKKFQKLEPKIKNIIISYNYNSNFELEVIVIIIFSIISYNNYYIFVRRQRVETNFKKF